MPFTVESPNPDAHPPAVAGGVVPERPLPGDGPTIAEQPGPSDQDLGAGMGGAGGDLGARVKAGLRWSLLNSMVGRLANFMVGVALARILAPRDYGVFAVALIVMQLLLSINDMGSSPAIIRCEEMDVAKVAATGATLTFLMSVVLFALMFLLAPVFTSLVHTPEATAVVRLMCVGVLIDGLFAVPSALLTRSLRQDRRLITDLTVLVTSAGTTITLALKGFGPWSLAWGQIGGNLAGGLAILAVTRVRLRPGWDRALARQQLVIGLPMTGAMLLQFGMLNTDSIVVGRFLGPVSLGIYVLAFNLSSWPVTVLASAVRRVSIVAFSRLRTDPAVLTGEAVRSFGLLVAVTAPACGLLAVLAVPLVQTIYGPQWTRSAGPLVFLAGLGACRVLVELLSDYLLALGRARRILLNQALWLGLLVPALVIAARIDGIDGVGLGHLVVAAGVILPLYIAALHSTGVRIPAVVKRAAWPVVATAGALGAAYAVLVSLKGSAIELLVGVGAALIVYVAFLYPFRISLLFSDPGRGSAAMAAVEEADDGET